jgi:type I restriction enzyme S subunit
VVSLGELPEHWRTGRLAYLLDLLVDGTHHSPESWPEGDFKYVTAKNIKEHGFDFSALTYIGADDHQEIYARCPVQRNDVLYIKDGATAGIAMVNPLDEEFSLLSSVALIRPTQSVLLPRFAAYHLNAGQFKQDAIQRLVGGAMTRFTVDMISRFLFAIPPLSEQSVISTFLDRETAKIDALIAEQQRLIELLQKKRQAFISHAVTKGLNPDAPMKDSGVEWLGEVPEHWSRMRLRALFRQEKRQDQLANPVLSVYRDYGVILKDSRDDNYNKTPEDLSTYQLVNCDDLVVSKMKAWQGSLGISSLQGITSPDYVVFAPHHNEYPPYLHFLLRSHGMISVYRSISNGIRPAQWRIEPGDFLDLPVFLPPVREQQLIAEHLSSQSGKFDHLMKESECFICLLQERRSALISAAVTGQIDVRGLVPSEAAP